MSTLANTILRPKSVGELITKITEKELSDIQTKETSGRARRRSSLVTVVYPKRKDRSSRLSVFGREG